MATTRKAPYFALVFLLGTTAAAASCSGCRSDRPTTPPPTTTARGGELTASFRSPFNSFNRYVDQSAAGDLLALLTQATLVRVDRPTDTLQPWLAESWSESPDGLAFTLKLRDGVRFSDGAPLSSADVVFSFQALYDPRTPQAPMASSVKVNDQPLKVEAPDPRTVVIRFPERFAPGLRLIEPVPILPKHKLQAAFDAGTFDKAWGASAPLQDLAGLGPFVVTENAAGQRLVLARNPHYWRKDAAGAPLPYLDKLTIAVIPDQNTEALRAAAGEVDLMSNGDIRPEDYPSFKRGADAGRLRLIEAGVGLDPNLLWFNLSPSRAADPRARWFGSKAFRQAVSCAIDRDAIVKTVYLGAATPIYGPVTPGNQTWYTAPAAPCTHDLAKARQLLAAAGLVDRDGDGLLEDGAGKPARFSVLTQQGHTIRERTVSMIQQQLRGVGIAVEVVGLDPNGLFARFGSRDYDAIYYGVQSSSTDPALNMQFWQSRGFFHFWNPAQPTPATPWERQIDELMRQHSTTRDLAERKRLFGDVQRIFAEELPAVYIAAPRMILAVTSKVQNERPAPQIPQLLWSADTLAARR